MLYLRSIMSVSITPSASVNVRLKGCRFLGQGRAVNIGTIGPVRLRMVGCHVASSVSGIRNPSESAPAGQMIELVDNEFLGAAFDKNGLSTSDIIIGRDNHIDLILLELTASGWQRLIMRKGVNPRGLSSSTDVALSPNYDVCHVCGTEAIENLYFLTSSDSRVTRMFSGTYRLIADDSWSLQSTGNIRPKRTGPRSTGEVVTLVYDSGTALWYEASS